MANNATAIMTAPTGTTIETTNFVGTSVKFINKGERWKRKGRKERKELTVTFPPWVNQIRLRCNNFSCFLKLEGKKEEERERKGKERERGKRKRKERGKRKRKRRTIVFPPWERGRINQIRLR